MLYLKLNCCNLKIKSCLCDFKRETAFTGCLHLQTKRAEAKRHELELPAGRTGCCTAPAMPLQQEPCHPDARFRKLFPQLHRQAQCSALLQCPPHKPGTYRPGRANAQRHGARHHCWARSPVPSLVVAIHSGGIPSPSTPEGCV